MNIAILGGSFDPPHLGHMLIAQQVLERLPVDKVWLMPCYQHTFDKKLSPVRNRFEMTKFLQSDNIVVSDFEIDTKSSGDSIDTLEALAKEYPQHKFSWVIGSDQLNDFHKWPRWNDIVTKFGLIIFPREIALPNLTSTVKKSLMLRELPKNVLVMDYPDLILTNISSTIIRERIKKKLSIDYLTLSEVATYITNRKLYT